MTPVLKDVLLFSCLAGLVTVVVLVAASLL
jgi:hypothetical protein